jgi:hypothetical protein
LGHFSTLSFFFSCLLFDLKDYYYVEGEQAVVNEEQDHVEEEEDEDREEIKEDEEELVEEEEENEELEGARRHTLKSTNVTT